MLLFDYFHFCFGLLGSISLVCGLILWYRERFYLFPIGEVVYVLHRINIANSLSFAINQFSLFYFALTDQESPVGTVISDSFGAALLITFNFFSASIILIASSNVLLRNGSESNSSPTCSIKHVLIALCTIEISSFFAVSFLCPFYDRLGFYSIFFVIACSNRVLFQIMGWYFVRRIQQRVSLIYESVGGIDTVEPSSREAELLNKFTFFVRFQAISTVLNFGTVFALLYESWILMEHFNDYRLFFRPRSVSFKYYPPIVSVLLALCIWYSYTVTAGIPLLDSQDAATASKQKQQQRGADLVMLSDEDFSIGMSVATPSSSLLSSDYLDVSDYFSDDRDPMGRPKLSSGWRMTNDGSNSGSNSSFVSASRTSSNSLSQNSKMVAGSPQLAGKNLIGRPNVLGGSQYSSHQPAQTISRSPHLQPSAGSLSSSVFPASSSPAWNFSFSSDPSDDMSFSEQNHNPYLAHLDGFSETQYETGTNRNHRLDSLSDRIPSTNVQAAVAAANLSFHPALFASTAHRLRPSSISNLSTHGYVSQPARRHLPSIDSEDDIPAPVLSMSVKV